MYQASPVAQVFGSSGYLVAVIASLSFAMQPRAKFLKSLILNILVTCVAVAFTIFGLWCSRQAQLNTQSPGSTALYNSSAAAVSAIFLFFSVFAVNSLRAVFTSLVTADEQRYPSLMLSVVMYSILSNVSFTSGYLLPEALPVYYLPKELLIEYLLAFGLAFGVNLLVLPVTSRQIFLVWLAFPPSDLGVLFFLFVGDIRPTQSSFDIYRPTIRSSL